MPDLIEETVRGIRARLKELAPVVAEYERLQAAYAALDSSGSQLDVGENKDTRRRRSRRGGRDRARPASRRSPPRASRGQNKRAVYAVIAGRPGVTVSEIAAVTGITKPLIYNTTRAGVQRGELHKVALPSGQNGFRTTGQQMSSQPDGSAP
jgi:hypothetical protein